MIKRMRRVMKVINIRKRGKVYQYGFEAGKIDGKKKTNN